MDPMARAGARMAKAKTGDGNLTDTAILPTEKNP
jgi:hypothetical protein